MPMKTKPKRKFIHCAAGFILILLAAARASGQTAPDGFNPAVGGSVESIAVLSDDRFILGGAFYTVSGRAQTNLARFHPDGRLDTNFVPAINIYGRRVAEQPDGRIVVAGIHLRPAPTTPIFLVRFETNGAVDMSFRPQLDVMPFALALQADGKVLVGGEFTKAGGQDRR